MVIKEEDIHDEIQLLNGILHEACEGDVSNFVIKIGIDRFIRKIAAIRVEDGNKIADLVFKNDELRERIREILENDYVRNGKKYRKIGRNEKIKEGALHSWCNGDLKPIIDTYTVGDVPHSFARERDFYNPLSDKEV